MRKQGTAKYRRRNSCPSASSRELCAWIAQPSESRVLRRNCSLRAQCTSFPCPEKRVYTFGSCPTRFLFPLRGLPPPRNRRPKPDARQALLERFFGLENQPGGRPSRLSSAGFVPSAICFLATPMKKRSILAAIRSCRPLQIVPASSRPSSALHRQFYPWNA